MSAEEICISAPKGQLSITISIGAAEWKRGESLTADTFKRADKALLEAKQTGKNKVVIG